MDEIIIKGARENNLKNIDITLPKNKLIVMTGVSGSGKSSLAFDTIYAEGQRRYVDSLSAYARQFLGGTSKPDVDSIEGLSPSISIDQKSTSIDQKSTNNNPRSTVGTVTEIYDFLRLLYARIGVPYCPNHHRPISSQSIEEMTIQIMKLDDGTKIRILSPVVYGEKGTQKDLLDNLRKEGFSRARIDGNDYDLSENITLEKNKKHFIEVIIDRLIVNENIRSRLYEAIEMACKKSNGKCVIDVIGGEQIIMSEKYACPDCDFSLPELEPRMFSFNAPYGACPECNGLGVKMKISEDLLIPDNTLSINDGGIKTVTVEQNTLYTEITTVAKYYDIDLNMPIKDIPRKKLDIILYGSPEPIDFKYLSRTGSSRTKTDYFEGIITNLERRQIETTAGWIREWIEGFMVEQVCPLCHGTRLKRDILSVLINKKNIYEMTELSIADLYEFMKNLKLTTEQKKISELLVKEIINRLEFLNNVGLGYISLSRSASTLSGGEAQRIRLATQIGSKLTGVLYVLDEPSIGLHQRDNEKLINSMKEMRDLGNTLIVVEHDTDTMMEADYLVDIGPGAGDDGGRVMAEGTPQEVMNNPNSLTGKYLRGELKIDVPKTRRKGNGLFLEVKGAKEHNLKNINVKFPLGKLICVTGVSGSGKSTLVNDILYNALMKKVYKSRTVVGECKEIKGLENIDKVVHITQDPIGRTPRSNPATYVSLFDDIRDLFADMKESMVLKRLK